MTMACLHILQLKPLNWFVLEIIRKRSTMFLQFVSVICFQVVFLSRAEIIDYCDPKWCPDQGKHIACNNDGSFGDDCTGVYWLEDLTKHQPLILELHNMYRNMLAEGKVLPYEPAVRMPVLRWEESLTYMAELNAKTCYFEHDECRSTSDFPYSGQNIYYAKTANGNLTLEDYITEAVEMWFLEHGDCNKDVINGFKLTEPQSGHFTALMLDRNDRVGCAFLKSVTPRLRKKPVVKVIFTCNYPATNIMDLPTYKPGPVASKCMEVDPVYEGLCANLVDPNDWDWYLD